MIFALLAAAAAQVAVPSAGDMSVDARVAALAAREARMSGRFEDTIYESPAMRAEIRRVGFEAGCRTIASVGRDVVERHGPAIEPRIAQAIRNVVPERSIAEARALTFLVPPFTTYRSRISDEIERIAAAPLADARADMRRTFLARTAALPAARGPAANRVAPRPDVAAALGRSGNWDLDDPAQLRFACAELRVAPSQRPIVTIGAAPAAAQRSALQQQQRFVNGTEAAAPAAPADVESVDSIVAALYEVISGPAGQRRDWARMRSLFTAGARLMPLGTSGLRIGGVDDYIEVSGPLLEENGFFEREIGRVTESWGDIAHVFSAYEARATENGPVVARGINSIQLVRHGGRWWVASLLWQRETPERPIPARYLNPNQD